MRSPTKRIPQHNLKYKPEDGRPRTGRNIGLLIIKIIIDLIRWIYFKSVIRRLVPLYTLVNLILVHIHGYIQGRHNISVWYIRTGNSICTLLHIIVRFMYKLGSSNYTKRHLVPTYLPTCTSSRRGSRTYKFELCILSRQDRVPTP